MIFSCLGIICGLCLSVILSVSAAVVGDLSSTDEDPTLGTYNVDINSLTVSGISSGAAESVQLHFQFSSEVKGSAMFAGGPYLCGRSPAEALFCLQAPDLQAFTLPSLNKAAQTFSDKDWIDNISNLNGSKAYIFAGTHDRTVYPHSGKNLQTQLEHFGVSVHAEYSIPAGHGMPVDNGKGGPCNLTNIMHSYMNECNYSGTYEMFKALYGPSIVKPLPGYVVKGSLLHFDQRPFIATPLLAGMSHTGMVYVPSKCTVSSPTPCKIHVALHGCLSNMQFLKDHFATRTDYIEVADLNNIVIIFPQTTISITAPFACYDWYGNTGLWYATKWGYQANAIRNMWRHVMGL